MNMNGVLYVLMINSKHMKYMKQWNTVSMPNVHMMPMTIYYLNISTIHFILTLLNDMNGHCICPKRPQQQEKQEEEIEEEVEEHVEEDGINDDVVMIIFVRMIVI